VATRKRAAKKTVKRRKRTVKELPTKLDFWAIAAQEVYKSCRRAGMTEELALAFAMDRDSWPDWVVDPSDPIKLTTPISS